MLIVVFIVLHLLYYPGSKYLLCIVLLLTAQGKFRFSWHISTFYMAYIYVFTYKMYLLFLLLYLLQQASTEGFQP